MIEKINTSSLSTSLKKMFKDIISLNPKYANRQDDIKKMRELESYKNCIIEVSKINRLVDKSIESDKGMTNNPDIITDVFASKILNFLYENEKMEISSETLETFFNLLKNKCINFLINLCYDVHFKLYLDGIRTAEQHIEIGNTKKYKSVIIKKPTKLDFDYSNATNVIDESRVSSNTKSIVEFNLLIPVNRLTPRNEKIQPEVELEIQKYLDLLRLYEIGRVVCLKFVVQCDFPLGFTLHKYIQSDKSSNELSYKIELNDAKDLKYFIETFYDKMPNDAIYSTTVELNRGDISFKWYKDALLEYPKNEIGIAMAISSCIASLESLYSSKDQSEGLAYKISLRVALIIGLSSNNNLSMIYDPSNVRKYVKRAYDVRSDTFHGTSLYVAEKTFRKAGFNSSREFHKTMLEYNRIMLLIYILINHEFDEISLKNLTEDMDDSLINELKRIELKQKLNNIRAINHVFKR